MNYIKHLNAVFEQFSKDSRLNPTHISLYVALFQFWNYNRFPEEFYVNREEVMKFSKIGSKSTYHRCIRELDSWKYLIYNPSHNPFKGSKVRLFHFGTSDGQAVDLNRPISGQALVSVINMNKQITNFYKLGQAEKKNEILSFFKNENWPKIEAEKFFNHYQGIGWKIGGKIKIVDWQATAQNWMLKFKEIQTQKNIFLPPFQNRDNLHTSKNKNYNEPL
ncbi:MAG: hypothetical protein WC389_04590 [Lutibacter sp.]|jgi:hypothetical protein